VIAAVQTHCSPLPSQVADLTAVYHRLGAINIAGQRYADLFRNVDNNIRYFNIASVQQSIVLCVDTSRAAVASEQPEQ